MPPVTSIDAVIKSSATESADVLSAQSVYTDDQAVAAGYISLSPVRLHHTPTTTLDTLSALVL